MHTNKNKTKGTRDIFSQRALYAGSNVYIQFSDSNKNATTAKAQKLVMIVFIQQSYRPTDQQIDRQTDR
jgi:hypothetical protein